MALCSDGMQSFSNACCRGFANAPTSAVIVEHDYCNPESERNVQPLGETGADQGQRPNDNLANKHTRPRREDPAHQTNRRAPNDLGEGEDGRGDAREIGGIGVAEQLQ